MPNPANRKEKRNGYIHWKLEKFEKKSGFSTRQHGQRPQGLDFSFNNVNCK